MSLTVLASPNLALATPKALAALSAAALAVRKLDEAVADLALAAK